MTFSRNVFVNCPFDKQYYPLLRPLLFTIIFGGLTPRISLERIGSGEPRIRKIVTLIRQSKFAVHDLSRIRAKKAGEYFRLNMPFELGLDVGCRTFRGGKWSGKRCLILEKEPYRFQAAISDLSNSDIAVHGDEPEEVIVAVRTWLVNAARCSLPGPATIWTRFLEFMSANFVRLKSQGFSDGNIENLHINELMRHMSKWVRQQ